MKKPRCGELIYHPPTPAEKARAAEIRADVRELFGDQIGESGEDILQFVKTFSDPAIAPMRNESAQPGRGEVDLTQAWSLTAGPELTAEAGRFRAYLRQAMRAELKAGATGKQIRLAIDPHRESYQVRVAPDEIVVTAHDRTGVLQALNRLQDQMETREGPFLLSNG